MEMQIWSNATTPTPSYNWQPVLQTLAFLPRALHVTDRLSMSSLRHTFVLALNFQRQHTFFHEASSGVGIGPLVSCKLPGGLLSSGTYLSFLLGAKTRLHKSSSKLDAANLICNPGMGLYLQAVQMSHLECGYVEKLFRGLKLSFLTIYLSAIAFFILWSFMGEILSFSLDQIVIYISSIK